MLPLHVAYRIYIANRMPIMDCDETFNYWEVLHFLLFRDKSFQTWEYANEFALRTYAYLTPLLGIGRMYLRILQSGILPSWLWPLLTEQELDPSRSSKIALFFLLRITLGATMAYAEVSFCRAIVEQGYTADAGMESRKEMSRRDKNNGETSFAATGTQYTSLWFTLVGWVTECLLLSSAGMAHSAAALLPSSTLMGLWMLAAAAFLRKQNGRFCILAITATLSIGWPFGVLVFVPLGAAVLVREQKQIMAFIFLRIVPISIVVQGLVVLVDYHHYGRFVSPSWNILLYNTQAGGDELYGVEPLSYYVKNLLLNFNYVALVGALGFLPLVLPLLRFDSSSATWLEGLTLMTPFYLWIWVVFPRPHKEERFLYPVYPCLCLGAAIASVSFTQGILNHPCWRNLYQRQRERYVRISVITLAILWTPAATISWSRTVALSKYYSAPLHLYAQLSVAVATETTSSFKLEESNAATSSTKIVCTCGEWYRFPSSFFIDSELPEVVFGFAPSTFTGQLPQPFAEDGSGPPTSISNHFNDKNQPEVGSYTPLESCDFVIELSTSLHSCIGQNGGNDEGTDWKPILKEPFFDAETSTSTLHRILYIPLLHDYAIQSGKVQYVDFVLYAK